MIRRCPLLAHLLVRGLAVSVVLVLAACGGSKQSAVEPQGSADIFSLLETSGDEALDNLFVGEVASGSAFLAIGTLGDQAVAYYCDGEGKGVWFKGTFSSGELALASSDGVKVVAKLKDDRVTGQLSGLGSAEISIDIVAAGTGDALIRIPREGTLPRSGLIVANFAVRGTIRSVSSSVQGTSGSTSITPIPAAGSSEASPIGLKVAAAAASPPKAVAPPIAVSPVAAPAAVRQTSVAGMEILRVGYLQCTDRLARLDDDLHRLIIEHFAARARLVSVLGDVPDGPQRADIQRQVELTDIAFDAKIRSIQAEMETLDAACDSFAERIKALGG